MDYGKRKKNLDIHCPGKKPRLISIDGDFYGFDIKTFRKTRGSIVSTLLEVKSFAAFSNPVIFVTRAEWEKALATSPNYFFVVWSIEGRKHKVINSKELEPFIPNDDSICKWEIIQINTAKWW
jgi:hypothetical protein